MLERHRAEYPIFYGWIRDNPKRNPIDAATIKEFDALGFGWFLTPTDLVKRSRLRKAAMTRPALPLLSYEPCMSNSLVEVIQVAAKVFGDNERLWRAWADQDPVFCDPSHSFASAAAALTERWATESRS